ncbi:MAG: AAA family ATPase [archaeon]
MTSKYTRIAVVGTYSSGKSVLVAELSRELALPVSADSVKAKFREARGAGDLRVLDRPIEAAYLSLAALAETATFENREAHFVTEGGTLNGVASAYVFTEEFGVPRELLFPLRTAGIGHAKRRYELVVYLPPEIPFERDGVRPDRPDLRLAIDSELVRLLDEEEIPYITVTGTVPERTRQVLLAAGALLPR